MTIEEYFGDWMDVIDRDELVKNICLVKDPKSKYFLCPAHKDVF